MRGVFDWLAEDKHYWIFFPLTLGVGIAVVGVFSWGFRWSEALVYITFGCSVTATLLQIAVTYSAQKLKAQRTRVPTRDDHERRTKLRNPKGILASFAWFCSKDNREHIELAQADLKKDLRAMRREGRSPAFIFAVMVWKAAGTIVPIVWDGAGRVLAKLIPLGKLIAKIKGL